MLLKRGADRQRLRPLHCVVLCVALSRTSNHYWGGLLWVRRLPVKSQNINVG